MAPDKALKIYENAFKNCTSMEKVYIPDDVTSIGNSAFYNCTNLKTVMMSENVRTIYEKAFYNCNAMKYFVCKNPNAAIGNYAVGYHKENNTNVKNSDFVIWGRGGNTQSYALNKGFQYLDVSNAPQIAANRFSDFMWQKTNTADSWGKNGKYYFNNAHLPYAKDNGEKFDGICYGMAAVSALTSSGYLSVSDYAPGFNKISDINTISDNLKSGENASDRNTNPFWNGKDARLMIYDVNYYSLHPEYYVYVNLTDGSWYWNGKSVYGNKYNPETCYFKMIHSFDNKIANYERHGFTSIDQFFAAIRNP